VPITIGKKPESSFADPLGLLSDCHRRIEHFLGLLITVTTDARGGTLTSEQRAALVAAGQYFREARRCEDEGALALSADARVTQYAGAHRAGGIEELKEDHVVLDRGRRSMPSSSNGWTTVRCLRTTYSVL
jgi:hypothetical protein